MAGARRRTFPAADPKVGITLDDLAEFLDEMRALELPGATPVRAMAMIEIDFADGARIQRITADPAMLEEAGS